MTFELFKKIIDNIQSLGIKKISLIGGEPLMNKDLLKMVQYTENKFSYVELFTNGTLLNERLLLELKPYITQFAFSIYSMEKNKHNSITRSDNSHRLTLNAIQLVKKHKVKYRTSTILMKSLEFKDYEIIKKNNSLSSLDVIRLSGRANFGLLNAELIKSKLITPKKFRKVIDEKVFLKRLKFHNCFSEKMYIDYDGEVYPCVMERSMSHGNVERGFFEFGLSDEITMFTKDRISGCSECEYRYFCDDCRPDRSSDSNNEKPWYCTYEPRSGNWINTEDFIDAILNGSNE
jgi:radical SAM protein with 4Fe4S-binding SPASM domain